MPRNRLSRLKRRIKFLISYLRDRPSSKYLSKNEVYRIANLPRRSPSTTRLFGKKISFPDGYWFLHSVNELFDEEVYKFNIETHSPFIIDCGANIGLSVIYFKTSYPSAKIIAFEPDKDIFKRLDDNVGQFNYGDVNLINKGVWNETTTLSFLAEGTLGGRISSQDEGKGESNIISIETVRLRDYLEQKVDFLKIDIEGAEYEVLVDCADSLKNVNYLFLEYHSQRNSTQKLNEILGIVTEAGFRYYIKEASHDVKYPFIDNKARWFDLQLNIFCFRT